MRIIAIMLSILIPIYNYNTKLLVSELHSQAQQANIEFEILCYDDGSKPEFKAENQTIQNIEKVRYTELPENMGRSGIRNKLGSDAQYDYLLFIDCDMGVKTPDFIRKYLQLVIKNGVVVGGITYSEQPPFEQEKLLRWTYGRDRESISYKVRRETPYRSFLSGNFLIAKNTFEQIRFDEDIKGYGHEDTVFGTELKQKKVPVVHIDNPLLHKGLESASEFVGKSEMAVQNLAKLIKEKRVDHDIKIFVAYQKVNTPIIRFFFMMYCALNKNRWLKNLHSGSPELKYLDLYKLGYLMKELRS